MVLIDLRLTFGADRHDYGAFRPSDYLIMQDDAVRGLRHAARHELVGDLVGPAVRKLHFLSGLKRSSTHQSLLHVLHA